MTKKRKEEKDTYETCAFLSTRTQKHRNLGKSDKKPERRLEERVWIRTGKRRWKGGKKITSRILEFVRKKKENLRSVAGTLLASHVRVTSFFSSSSLILTFVFIVVAVVLHLTQFSYKLLSNTSRRIVVVGFLHKNLLLLTFYTSRRKKKWNKDDEKIFQRTPREFSFVLSHQQGESNVSLGNLLLFHRSIVKEIISINNIKIHFTMKYRRKIVKNHGKVDKRSLKFYKILANCSKYSPGNTIFLLWES